MLLRTVDDSYWDEPNASLKSPRYTRRDTYTGRVTQSNYSRLECIANLAGSSMRDCGRRMALGVTKHSADNAAEIKDCE